MHIAFIFFLHISNQLPNVVLQSRKTAAKHYLSTEAVQTLENIYQITNVILAQIDKLQSYFRVSMDKLQ